MFYGNILWRILTIKIYFKYNLLNLKRSNDNIILFVKCD